MFLILFTLSFSIVDLIKLIVKFLIVIGKSLIMLVLILITDFDCLSRFPCLKDRF